MNRCVARYTLHYAPRALHRPCTFTAHLYTPPPRFQFPPLLCVFVCVTRVLCQIPLRATYSPMVYDGERNVPYVRMGPRGVSDTCCLVIQTLLVCVAGRASLLRTCSLWSASAVALPHRATLLWFSGHEDTARLQCDCAAQGSWVRNQSNTCTNCCSSIMPSFCLCSFCCRLYDCCLSVCLVVTVGLAVVRC